MSGSRRIAPAAGEVTEPAEIRILLIDNYDSYTYNLYHLVAATLRAGVDVVKNDSVELDLPLDHRYDAIVLSPGPGSPLEPSAVAKVTGVLQRTSLPVLGVCLGHQLMGVLSGATISRSRIPRHGFVDRVVHDGGAMFDGIPQHFNAVRYHSLEVSGPVPPAISVAARGMDGTIMALTYRDKPWWGVQFHPESICTEFGDTLVRNFGSFLRESRSVPFRSMAKR